MVNNQQKKSITEALAVIIICAVIAGGIRLAIPRSYSSTAALLFPGGTSQAGAISGASGTTAPEIPGTTGGGADQPSLPLMQGVLNVPQPGTSPATAGMILKSRQTTEELIKRFDLQNVWGYTFERSVERLQDDLQCIAGSSGDLRIIYTDTSPKRTKEVASYALKLLTDSIEKLSLDPAGRNLRFLKESLLKAERACESAQKSLVDFQSATGGAPPDSQILTLGQTYSDIQKDLIRARADVTAAGSAESTTRQLNTRMIQSAQDPTNSEKSLISILYSKVITDESELSLLKQKYTDKRPEVVIAAKQLEVDRQSLNHEIDRQTKGMKNGSSPFISQSVVSASTADSRAKELESALLRIRQQMRTLPAAQAQYGQLTANLRDERARLSLVRSEYVKAQLITQSRGPQFVVLDQPVVPLRANGIDPWVYFLIGGSCGLVIVFIRFFVARLKQSIVPD